MKCPKCNAEQDDRNLLCDRCGIVFEKYYKYHPRPGQASATPPGVEHAWSLSGEPDGLILPSDVPGDRTVLWARAVLFGVLLLWGLALILSSLDSNAVGRSFLHLVNLPFHEAGHVFFRPFGNLIASLGGTLGQLLMPAICLGVLLVKTRDPFGASVALWWFGENFLDIAPYIADARARVLPLIGGGTGQSSPYGHHDWEFLLTETGLLNLDQTLGRLSHLLGSALMLLALVWGFLLLRRQWRRLRLER